MPLYEYECSAGDHRFEAFNSIQNRQTTTCPEHGTEAQKKITSVNLTHGIGGRTNSPEVQQGLDALHHPEDYSIETLKDKAKGVLKQIEKIDQSMGGAISREVAKMQTKD
jgi:putative FmdB family regulatory protein